MWTSNSRFTGQAYVHLLLFLFSVKACSDHGIHRELCRCFCIFSKTAHICPWRMLFISMCVNVLIMCMQCILLLSLAFVQVKLQAKLLWHTSNALIMFMLLKSVWIWLFPRDKKIWPLDITHFVQPTFFISKSYLGPKKLYFM